MKNKLYILLILALGMGFSSARAQVIVSGTVADEVEPLMMVNVVEVDETGRFVEATTTDINGNFSLRVKNTKDKLQFSYIGYKTQLLPIGERKVFNIIMKDENLIRMLALPCHSSPLSALPPSPFHYPPHTSLVCNIFRKKTGE